ncbi:hypothetical protein TgHK011_007715 [Trichoderma gracile]|nr:hypothetical protein TgHK011_007715 [Trichoderma gracile]
MAESLVVALLNPTQHIGGEGCETGTVSGRHSFPVASREGTVQPRVTAAQHAITEYRSKPIRNQRPCEETRWRVQPEKGWVEGKNHSIESEQAM